MLAVSSSTWCLNGWTTTTSSWCCWRWAVYCIVKQRAALHSAVLLDSCTAERLSDRRTTSRRYGDCSYYINGWEASAVISSGGVDTLVAQRAVLVGSITVTAGAVVMVTYGDKVHRSAAVSRQWLLIQQVSQWSPMSVHLIWMLPYQQNTLTQSQTMALEMVKFSRVSSTKPNNKSSLGKWPMKWCAFVHIGYISILIQNVNTKREVLYRFIHALDQVFQRTPPPFVIQEHKFPANKQKQQAVTFTHLWWLKESEIQLSYKLQNFDQCQDSNWWTAENSWRGFYTNMAITWLHNSSISNEDESTGLFPEISWLFGNITAISSNELAHSVHDADLVAGMYWLKGRFVRT